MNSLLFMIAAWSLAAAAAVYLLIGLGLYLFQYRLVYIPNKIVWRTPADAGLAYEEHYLTAADGVRLHSWFIPAPDNHGTILFFHGNAGNIAHRLETVHMLREWGFNTFLLDYRGFGQSEGHPSEAGTRQDSRAAWRFLTEEKKINARRIVVFGRSLGAAVAGDLVARVQPAGAILESGFTSIPDVAADLYRWWPVRLLSRNRYPTVENITHFQCPVLIAHSREDDLIPFSHGERLFQAAPEPKYFLEMVGTHRGCVTASGMPYQRAIKSFLDEALLISPPKSPE